MAGITIVAGAPGTGKTTLARSLAEAKQSGLHLLSDDFYRYPGHVIAPTAPESREQNETIMRALARASSAFFEGGYDVYVDGVIGPWMLPIFAGELAPSVPLDYVVLRSDLELALRRVRERQGSGASAAVEKMHREFADLKGLRGVAIETSGRSPAEILAEFERRCAKGEFRLDPAMRKRRE